ncbi:2-isopropylmalate synthase [Desulfacinum hydrothermale DSM 13146]|uniref:2-isopropylmalate synthase n=2 Tax=Desulfacinum hydrothermale TaxID=109258 RepID=A0A1W1XCA4_9BACT|nr:2-isopropylmalate synthase [Desulfacinum hydrothermale]SMC21318.1 2-isopropylmalate synthase [Desulfacinum hydrothermale DSM 13146]
MGLDGPVDLCDAGGPLSTPVQESLNWNTPQRKESTMSRKIHIFDTTLRDGEQVPGAKLNRRQKLEIAEQLARLGVDVIEAGFPCSSPEDLKAVQTVAEQVKGPVIAGLARAVQQDIDIAWEAVKKAERPRIHVFLGSSDIHLQKKLRRDRESALHQAVEAVKYAKKYCEDVEYSTEDASRSDFDYLCRVIEACIQAGATVINVPDTVGYALPEQYGELIRNLREKVPALDKVILSVHCHNDLGLAVANSLAAVRNGAEQVECTINGVGERAGNASLEEIVMAIRTRESFFDAHTTLNTKEIYRTSRMVSRLMNIPVQPNKAIVGSNAFAHSSGIHQDGILKDRSTYEIIRPEDVGIKAHSLVLTARSGRAALRHRLEELGYELTDEQFQKVHKRFLNVADRKKEISSQDLATIVEIELTKVSETYTFDSLQTMSGNTMQPLASVTLIKDDEKITDAATGNGPVNAVFNCIERIVGESGELRDYDLKAVTTGKDALGEAMVRVEIRGAIYSGIGTSPDVIEASARAYVNAFNRFFANGNG